MGYFPLRREPSPQPREHSVRQVAHRIGARMNARITLHPGELPRRMPNVAPAMRPAVMPVARPTPEASSPFPRIPAKKVKTGGVINKMAMDLKLIGAEFLWRSD